MQKSFTVLFLILATSICGGQNLVLNGGFENNSQLPGGAGQYYYCNGWNNCSGFGTPDYFHMNGSGLAQLPNCYVSYLLPHSGDATMGISLQGISPFGGSQNFREYMSESLSSPLTIGQNYQLSFFISNGSPPIEYGGFGCDHFSVAFSTMQLIQSTSQTNLVINFNPQIVYNGILYNNNWQLLSFNFIADSAYEHITFGSFVSDAIQQVQQYDSFAFLPYVYYYLDDISLENSTGLNNTVSLLDSISLYPCPFSNELTIQINQKDDYNITIYDIHSRKILQQKIKTTISMNTESFSYGIYYYEIRKNDFLIKSGKILKN